MTVLINGRTAVHAGSGGILTTVDICKTQVGPSVIPLPYTNIAKTEDADNTAATVFINGYPVCTAASTLAISTGDQAGKHGGIRSGTTEGVAEFLTHSPDVFIEGFPAVRMGDLMISNNGNTPPAPLMQPGAPLPPELKAAALNPVALPVTNELDFVTTHTQHSGMQLQDSHPVEAAAASTPEPAAATPAPTPIAGQETPEDTTENQEEALEFAPPVLINLRNDAPAGNAQLLSQEQLDYFKDNGNNALVFVHGYNVALGEFGQPNSTDALPVDVYRPTKPRSSNGIGAHSWLLNIEYQLNRAAGYQGHDQKNRHPYQRILCIAWEGNVGSANFYGATLNALTAGRRLSAVLHQLIEANIKINLMAHSLGARVLLTAMNLLAETHTQAIDHVFLWQPAVADNTLSNHIENDTHPFGAGVLPQAHQAAKQIIVLHSSNDGVLGGHGSVGNFFNDLGNNNHQALTGALGGAYRKKWWDITLLGAGIRTVLDKLYADYGALHISALDSGVQPNTRPPQDPAELKQFQERLQQIHEQNQNKVAANWQRLEQDLKQEMQQHLNATDTPEYHLLAPIAINRVLDEQAVNTYIQRLRAYYNGQHEESPRPALGYEGFFKVKDEDDFIKRMLASEDFIEVDQQDVLFGHSGMRIPSEALFEEVYVKEIWQRLKTESRFGLYS